MMVGRALNVGSLHKLADNGVTAPELRQLCEEILRNYSVPLLAIELASILKSDYNKDVSPIRVANTLSDDNKVQRGRFKDIPLRTFKSFNEKNNMEYYKKFWYWV